MRKLLLGLAVATVLGASAGSAVAGQSSCSTGTCDSGGCKTSFWDKFKRNSDGCNNGCGSKGFGFWDWLKAPCPSGAPRCRGGLDGQLAFPSHPYIRSPRDYFMDD